MKYFCYVTRCGGSPEAKEKNFNQNDKTNIS